MPRSNEPRDLVASGEFVQAGRLYESAHRFEDAINAYLLGGAYNDAARLLSHQGRFREAGETLLFYLPPQTTPTDRLTADQRTHAMNAALCFARGGARREAVGLLLNLGENQKAASLLQMAGLRQAAVQAMRGEPLDGNPWPPGVLFPLKPAPPRGRRTTSPRSPRPAGGSGLVETASGRYMRRAMPPDTRSRSLRRPSTHPSRSLRTDRSDRSLSTEQPLGDRRLRTGSRGQADASQALMEIRPGDPRLPGAVNDVLRARWRQEPLSPRLLTFLDRYVDAGSQGDVTDAERPTYYAIGRLYEFHDRLGAARKAYRIAAAGPGVADAVTRLDQLDAGLVQTTEGLWLPLHHVVDGKKHDFAELPELGRLPPLGSPPPPPEEAMDFDDYMAAPTRSPARPSGTHPTESRSVSSGSPRSGDADRSRASKHDSSWSRSEGSGPLGPIEEGSTIADRYRIERLIGQGGMGTVYEATDAELDEVIAIKVFQQVVQNKKGLERFRREMKLSRKLIHPNIVRIYEFGTWRGARYITMELLRGHDLEEYAERHGRVPTAQALSLLMQCCDGLTAAHRHGIIHRDIKPQNLFVVDEGKHLKIMDFGIAKVSNGASISITGVRVGTPRYMSPEQIQGGGQVGPQADLYALGGVMYELFTGSPVFEEEELVPLLLNHMTEDPIPPSVRNPDIPPSVEHIIMRLLQKNPDDRYRDAAELKRELLAAYVQAERLPPS